MCTLFKTKCVVVVYTVLTLRIAYCAPFSKFRNLNKKISIIQKNGNLNPKEKNEPRKCSYKYIYDHLYLLIKQKQEVTMLVSR